MSPYFKKVFLTRIAAAAEYSFEGVDEFEEAELTGEGEGSVVESGAFSTSESSD